MTHNVCMLFMVALAGLSASAQTETGHVRSAPTLEANATDCWLNLMQLRTSQKRRGALARAGDSQASPAHIHPWPADLQMEHADLLQNPRWGTARSENLGWDTARSEHWNHRVSADASLFGIAAKPTLCGLVRNGTLVDEAWIFLRQYAGPSELAAQLDLTWVNACTTNGSLSDIRLLSMLRTEVRKYRPVTTTASKSKSKSKTGVAKTAATTTPGPGSPLEECMPEDALFLSMGLNASVRVMDYGCGSGARLVNLKRCGHGESNVGVDVQDVRTKEAKTSFEFVQLKSPYVESLSMEISNRNFEEAFQLIVSEVTFHHIGSEAAIRATATQLGRVMAPCAVFELSEWDNDPDPSTGRPDLTPLFDLLHTMDATLCLPWSPMAECDGELTDEDLHEMWEGPATVYLSRVKYEHILKEQAGLNLVSTSSDPSETLAKIRQNGTIAANGRNALRHSFTDVFRKGSDCA